MDRPLQQNVEFVTSKHIKPRNAFQLILSKCSNPNFPWSPLDGYKHMFVNNIFIDYIEPNSIKILKSQVLLKSLLLYINAALILYDKTYAIM